MSYKVIQPLGPRLLVEPIKKQEETLESGVILAETVNAELSEGIISKMSKEVTAFYREKGLEDADIPKEGWRVVFSAGTGQGQFQKGKQLLWLRLDELWGFVTKEG